MKMYKIKKVKDGKVSLLHLTYCLTFAKQYAIDWSNENNCSCLIYGKNDNRALMYTHRISENNYQLFR